MSRPEHIAPAAIYYGAENAGKYVENSRMAKIQGQMTERALQLLLLSEPLNEKLVLDLGCGTGMSCVKLNEFGITVIGTDISDAMLREGVVEEDDDCEEEEGMEEEGMEEEGMEELSVDEDVNEPVGGVTEFIQSDMGSSMGFRDGIFDGVVSISALQWLLNADGGEKHEPYKRLRILFTSLRRVLKRGGRAVFQFYPESAEQVEMITSCAMRCGFGGGVVVDFPHSTRAKKTYLVIHTGFQGNSGAAATMTTSETVARPAEKPSRVTNMGRAKNVKKTTNKNSVKSRGWIIEKKDRQRRQGKDVKEDSKYTGRKRKDRF